MRVYIFCLIICVCCLTSCQTTKRLRKEGESVGDVKKAVRIMAEVVSGQEMTDAQVKKLMKDLSHDPEAQSAVQVIKESISADEAGRIKYSPATGKRYAPHLEYDPETGVRLEYVE